jgi:hypothetical protein
MVTIDDAIALAKEIKANSPQVSAIELFGSVLTKGQGQDMDFIFIVDDVVSHNFWLTTNKVGSQGPLPPTFVRRFTKKFLPFVERLFSKNKRSRKASASQLIGLELNGIVDPWLMPHNWRSQITTITSNSNMRKVLSHAANYAIKIA